MIQNITDMKMVYLKEDIGVLFGGKIAKKELVVFFKQKLQALAEAKNYLRKHRSEIDKYAPDYVNLANWLVMHHIMHIEVEIKWFRRIMQELLDGKLYPPAYKVAGRKSNGKS